MWPCQPEYILNSNKLINIERDFVHILLGRSTFISLKQRVLNFPEKEF